MIDNSIRQLAETNLRKRIESLCDLKLSEPIQREFSLQSICDSKAGHEAKVWLENSLGDRVKGRFIYCLSGSSNEVAEKLYDKFEKKSSEKKSVRGYALPRNNKNKIGADVGTCLYVGSSKNIRSRLKQHLCRAPRDTYGLNMKHWVPNIFGSVVVEVQCFIGESSDASVQDIEDALWRCRQPMFGKMGGT
ncbi:GIY-YIG nuclease family protein [Rhodobacteraceae bacterium M382]|nr:GIY-YIG nuclease family protein [Rhodobacteraceae bacterium M382]